ncbi:MAG TPA: hypothetical protein VGF98_09125 [Candidatus Tumulicola sp.]|jgi:hypothetical protein
MSTNDQLQQILSLVEKRTEAERLSWKAVGDEYHVDLPPYKVVLRRSISMDLTYGPRMVLYDAEGNTLATLDASKDSGLMQRLDYLMHVARKQALRVDVSLADIVAKLSAEKEES